MFNLLYKIIFLLKILIWNFSLIFRKFLNLIFIFLKSKKDFFFLIFWKHNKTSFIPCAIGSLKNFLKILLDRWIWFRSPDILRILLRLLLLFALSLIKNYFFYSIHNHFIWPHFNHSRTFWLNRYYSWKFTYFLFV